MNIRNNKDNKNQNEQKIKTEFLRRWTGWSDTFEPARGSGVGFPDCQLVLEGDIAIPIEFKKGTEYKNSITIAQIRAAQVSWHTRYNAEGHKSFFVVGVFAENGTIDLYICTAKYALNQRHYAGGCIADNEFYLLPSDDSFSDAVKNFVSKGTNLGQET